MSDCLKKIHDGLLLIDSICTGIFTAKPYFIYAIVKCLVMRKRMMYEVNAITNHVDRIRHELASGKACFAVGAVT